MSELSQHQMQLEVTHPSGAEEWACPECGRRLLMQWPPTYRRVVLEAGDEFAIHSGSKGGLTLIASQLNDSSALADEFSQGPWAEWLEELDFGDSWGGDARLDSEDPE